MKALGLGAAGAGTVAAAVPLFKDLDDMMSHGETLDHTFKRAWYIKERPLGDPTTETDWSMVKGHENNYIMNSTGGQNYGFTAEERAERSRLGSEAAAAGVARGYGGFMTRDYALSNGAGVVLNFDWTQPKTFGYLNVSGLPKYQGSPEENSKILRAAATFLGASSVGFAVLEGDEKKICNIVHSEGRPFAWEDVEWPYDTDAKIVVPNNRTLYAIAIAEEFSKELWRHGTNDFGAGQMRGAANSDRYRRWSIVYRGLQRFLTYMGYMAFGYPNHQARGLLPAAADGILTGLCEGGRNANINISPEHGMCQGYFSLVTDLPLAPTAPIDAGIRRFCKTCGKCAETCPTNAISHDKEPTFDLFDPNLYQFNKNNAVKFIAPGKKNWVSDSYACAWGTNIRSGCCNCMGGCTFNVNNGAGIHSLVKSTVGATSLFNGFFARADSIYGFGLTPDDKKAEWWDKSLPVSGIDSTICASDGAYRKRAY